MTRDEVNAARIEIARERLELTKRRLMLAERKQRFVESRADTPRVHIVKTQKLRAEQPRNDRELLRDRMRGEG